MILVIAAHHVSILPTPPMADGLAMLLQADYAASSSTTRAGPPSPIPPPTFPGSTQPSGAAIPALVEQATLTKAMILMERDSTFAASLATADPILVRQLLRPELQSHAAHLAGSGTSSRVFSPPQSPFGSTPPSPPRVAMM